MRGAGGCFPASASFLAFLRGGSCDAVDFDAAATAATAPLEEEQEGERSPASARSFCLASHFPASVAAAIMTSSSSTPGPSAAPRRNAAYDVGLS